VTLPVKSIQSSGSKMKGLITHETIAKSETMVREAETIPMPWSMNGFIGITKIILITIVMTRYADQPCS